MDETNEVIELDRSRGDVQRKSARSNDVFKPVTRFLNELLLDAPPLAIARDHLTNAWRLSIKLVAEPRDTEIAATNCEQLASSEQRIRREGRHGHSVILFDDHTPRIAAGNVAGRRVVACGFRLESTDLQLCTAFPLLLINALAWLRGLP